MKKTLVGTPIERASRWMFTRIISSLARTLRDEELSIAQLAALPQFVAHVDGQRLHWSLGPTLFTAETAQLFPAAPRGEGEQGFSVR